MKFVCTDLEFPRTTESLLFSVMWVNMLTESLREITYMSELAGVVAQIGTKPDHIFFTLSSYNDGYLEAISQFFRAL